MAPCGGGLCTSEPNPAGTACAGGVCDNSGVCQAGCWISGALVAPGSPDPAALCSACRPSVSTTSYSVVADGAGCSNGIMCDGAETCVSGHCVSPGNPCPVSRPFCNEGLGRCDACNVGSCDNGNMCDGTESCNAMGDCVSTNVNPCSGTEPECNASNQTCECNNASCTGLLVVCLNGRCTPL